MMRRVIPGVLIVLGVLALGAFVASRGDTTQASDARPTQEKEVSQLRGTAQEGEEDEKIPYVGIALTDKGGESGVLVVRVMDGSPADGKLQGGDVITGINGDAVSSAADVAEMVRGAEPGDALTFSVTRDGDSLDVDVTVGEREAEVRIFRSHKAFPAPGGPLFGRFGGMMDRIIKAEVKVETDEGVMTYRVAVGTVAGVDAEAGTFDLVLKDGSETLSYEISEDTRVVMEHEGDLSGLNTEDTTLVVEVEDESGQRTVKLVAQGVHQGRYPRLHRYGEGFGSRFFERDFRGAPYIPEIRERLRDFLAPGSLEDMEGRLFDMERFLDELPEDFGERLEIIPFGPGRIEIEKEIILDSSPI